MTMLPGRALAAASLAALTGLANAAAAQTMDAEFNAQWGLAYVGAQYALARGLTGTGVDVVVVDSLFQLDHPEFTGRVGTYIYNPNAYSAGDHGTNVAGILGAGRNGFGMEGVAPNVTLNSIAMFSGSGSSSLSHSLLSDGYKGAIAAGMRIFNNSWGLSIERDITTQTVADAMGVLGPELLEAFEGVTQAGGVMVWAAGNAGMANPDLYPGLPYLFPQLTPGWIVATGVNKALQNPGLNKCGVSALYCIAAPGYDIYTTDVGSSYDTDTGTSFAAPHVTGAVAIAKQMFPNATGAQLANLVMRTASDIGTPGIDTEFGWGLLNLGNLVTTTDSATGSVFTNSSFGRFAAVDTVVTTLWDRSAQRIMGGGRGTPVAVAQSQSAYQPSMALGGPGAGSYMASEDAALYARAPAVWAQGLLAHASIEASANSAKAGIDLGGAVGGYELVDEGPWRGGFAIAFTQSNLDGADDGSAQGWHGFAYATWQQAGWFVDGVIGGNWFDNSYKRSNILGTQGTVLAGQGLTGSSSNDTGGFAGHLTAGHLYEFRDVTLMPYAYASWLYQKTGGFNETGADIFSLTAGSNTLDQVEGGIGARAQIGSLFWQAFSILPSVDMAYGRLGGDVAFPVGLELLGTPVAARATDIGRGVLRVGAQLNAVRFDNMVSGYVGFDGRFQEKAQNNTFSGGVTVKF
jgi:subtilase-type serine protease